MAKKRALVTGGSGAIGAVICQRLAADGYTVIVHAHRHPDSAERVAEKIVANGGSATMTTFDIIDGAATAQALRNLLAGGAIQVVVNNAGVHEDGPMAGMTEEQWKHVIDVSLNGFFHVTQPLLLPMIGTRWGRIVSISSLAAVTGNRGQTNYAAAKAGLHGASKSLAIELASRGITVNVVAPGLIESPATRASFKPEQIETIVPMKRVGTPEEVAALVSAGGVSVAQAATSREAAARAKQVFLAERLGESASVPDTVCVKVSPRMDGWLREAYFGQVLEGHSTPGSFMSFLTALFMLYEPVKGVSKVNSSLQQGIAAANRLDSAAAVRCFDAVLSREPDHSQALLLRGQVARESGSPEQALEFWKRVPDFPAGDGSKARYLEGALRIESGQAREAEQRRREPVGEAVLAEQLRAQLPRQPEAHHDADAPGGDQRHRELDRVAQRRVGVARERRPDGGAGHGRHRAAVRWRRDASRTSHCGLAAGV